MLCALGFLRGHDVGLQHVLAFFYLHVGLVFHGLGQRVYIFSSKPGSVEILPLGQMDAAAFIIAHHGVKPAFPEVLPIIHQVLHAGILLRSGRSYLPCGAKAERYAGEYPLGYIGSPRGAGQRLLAPVLGIVPHLARYPGTADRTSQRGCSAVQIKRHVWGRHHVKDISILRPIYGAFRVLYRYWGRYGSRFYPWSLIRA